MRGTLVSSAILFALAVAYWLGADAIPESSLGGGVGADGLPKLLGVTLGLLSVGLALQTVATERRRRLSAGGSTGGEGQVDWGKHARALGVIGIGLAFVVLLPFLGYALSVGLLLMTIATYAGKRPSLSTLVFGIVGAVAFYLLFVWLLQVPLPSGFWPSLLNGA